MGGHYFTPTPAPKYSSKKSHLVWFPIEEPSRMVHCPPTSRARRSPSEPRDIPSSFLSPVLVKLFEFRISSKPVFRWTHKPISAGQAHSLPGTLEGLSTLGKRGPKPCCTTPGSPTTASPPRPPSIQSLLTRCSRDTNRKSLKISTPLADTAGMSV